jgi:hypothetical protein
MNGLIRGQAKNTLNGDLSGTHDAPQDVYILGTQLLEYSKDTFFVAIQLKIGLVAIHIDRMQVAFQDDSLELALGLHQ